MIYFIWILFLYGVTMIVTETTIFEPLRNSVKNLNGWLGDLLSCPRCFGFWVGIACQSGYDIFEHLDNIEINYFVSIFVVGVFSSAINWLLYQIVTFFEVKINLIQIKTEQIIDNLENERKKIKII